MQDVLVGAERAARRLRGPHGRLSLRVPHGRVCGGHEAQVSDVCACHMCACAWIACAHAAAAIAQRDRRVCGASRPHARRVQKEVGCCSCGCSWFWCWWCPPSASRARCGRAPRQGRCQRRVGGRDVLMISHPFAFSTETLDRSMPEIARAARKPARLHVACAACARTTPTRSPRRRKHQPDCLSHRSFMPMLARARLLAQLTSPRLFESGKLNNNKKGSIGLWLCKVDHLPA